MKMNGDHMVFHPTHKYISSMSEYREQTIINEPMFFQASPEYAYHYGGTMTKEFIDECDIRFSDEYVVDSRVHMLKPGWYPCIPGWHLDGIRRPDGQPDFVNIPKNDNHLLSVIGPTSMTEFLNRRVKLHRPDPENVYQSFTRQINLQISSNVAEPVSYPSGSIIEFGPTDFHRGVAADEHGWRFFIRASKDGSVPLNNQRTQVQVYLDEKDKGW